MLKLGTFLITLSWSSLLLLVKLETALPETFNKSTLMERRSTSGELANCREGERIRECASLWQAHGGMDNSEIVLPTIEADGCLPITSDQL